MAPLSNFRVYAERKYTDDGEWKSEEIELGQCARWTNVDPIPDDVKFTMFGENQLTTAFQSFFYEMAYPECFSFKPGLIYFPPKIFSIFDLFKASDIQEFYREMVVNWGVNYHTSNYILKFASEIFWQNPDGYNFTPFILGQYLKSSYNINDDSPEKIRTVTVYTVAFIATKLNTDNIIVKDNGYYYVNEDETTRKLVANVDYFLAPVPNSAHEYQGIMSGGPIFSSSKRPYPAYATQQENINGLLRFIQILQKVKVVPIWNGSFNPYEDENNIWWQRQLCIWDKPETVEETAISHSQRDNMTLLFDISDCPYFPMSGFGSRFIQFQRGTSHYKYPSLGVVTRIDWSGGPEPNNPDETDDPNDEDPGHGNGDDPDDKGGDGDHDNTSDIIEPPGIPPISATGVGLVSVYNPTSSQLAALGAKLWNPTALDTIKQYFTNPMETILGLSIVPVSPRTGVSKNIHLGVYDTEVSALLVDSDYVIINCGSIPINRYYGSYLDYDPYTKITCYLPYIGEIEVNPDQVMQKSLKVLYYVNVITGDIVAMLCADGSIIYTVAGNCIRQLPMSQTDYSAIINTAVSAVSTIASAAVGASAAGAVGGAVAGAAKTSAGAAVAEARTSAEISNQVMGAGNSLINQVMSSKMRYNHAGSIGTGSGQLTYQTPYLTIERPNLDLADSYKSFVGYPCNKTMQLSRCTGFTQIEATKLSIPGATDEEITEILQFLVEGVII